MAIGDAPLGLEPLGESMTTINLSFESVCSGGGHASFGLAVNGGAKSIVNVDVAAVLAPLDEDEKKRIITDLIRIHSIGRSKAQVLADFPLLMTI